MAKEKIAGTLATNIGVNTTSAVQSIDSLKNSVKDSTNSCKQMESQMKQAGDTVGASKAKYEGLTETVDKQKLLLEKLRQEQSEVNRSTTAGEQTYQKYATQITQAESKLASLNTQQEKAQRAYELQESGIASLNKEIQQSIKETDAYVERLKAEGKEEEALQAQKEGLSRTLGKQTELYEAQTKQLDKLKKSGNASSDSISAQKIALDKTGASIAKAKQGLAELNGEQTAVGKSEGAEEAGGKFEGLKNKIGKSQGAVVALGAASVATLATIGKLVDKVYDQQSQITTLQSKTTGSYQQSKEAISAINQLYAQGYGESIEDLTETYTQLKQMNPNADVKDLAENVKLVSAYSQQSGSDSSEVIAGAQNATKAWNISYEEYFDNMMTLQKLGDNTAGDVSDNMAEYSQVMGQMGLSIKDTMNLIKNGVDSGAYNADKLLDFTKEFGISLNDGRVSDNIKSFSKETQEMFKGYQKGKVSAGDMFKQITGEMGKMTDKQKEATLASNLWSALGEDNSLKVLESLGKTNKEFDNVKGTAKKTADQLKESNPFELMKRSAESSISSVTMNATQTKKFKEALKPLQEAIERLVKKAVQELPKIVKELTPIVDFVTEHGKTITKVLTGILAIGFATKALSGITKLSEGLKTVGKIAKGVGKTPAFAKGLFVKVDSKEGTKSLTLLGKGASKLGDGFKKTRELASKTFSKTTELAGKALSKTGELATKGVSKTLKGIQKTVSTAGKGIAKAATFTAKVSVKAAQKALNGLLKTAKMTGKGMKLAFNFLKANPFILIITGIVALVAAFVELYKHNKKFRKFVNNIVKAVVEWAGDVVKWFKKTWDDVSKGFNSFIKAFSKGWNNLLNGIKNTWNGAWSYVSNAFNKYVDVLKKVLKIFTDFFTGKWGNLGKDVKNLWNSLWNYVESIFGKKVDSVKKGLEGFGTKIANAFKVIKTNVTKFWTDMWNGIKDFAKGGINDVIGVINNGIGGINTVIHTFGGSKNAIGKIPKLKNGTKGAPKGLAIVNDAPGEHYQEAIIDKTGKATVLEGRNRLVNFSGGETVVPAHAIPKFADGTPGWMDAVGSWIKDKWDGLTEMIKHPLKSLTNLMTKSISGITGSTLVTSIAPALGQGLVSNIVEPIKKMLGSLKTKHEKDGGGSQGSPSGSGVQRWAGQVQQALAANGLSTSQDMVDRVLRQIASESSGNEKAVQGNIGDINNITGDLAKGLMQTISATFNAYKFPGHGDIFNGYDNLLAALNYAKSRYGPSLSFLGNGHGYANGGIVSSHGFYEVAEENKPEMIIPLSVEKNARANQLLAEANRRINGGNSLNSSGMAQGVSQIITLLSNLLEATQKTTNAPVVAEVSLNDKTFSKRLAPEMQNALNKVQSRTNRLGGQPS
ncbi:phage tail tape measure protein [Lactococcus taiwanensis]|uniref:phage tail tape measure protein n=1 Tax=Lactococcus taiwanensis TaxID=1151742 RepID=UPI00289A2C58|nr:phage tail tape measure protein [Lactococcus taiwanensis]